MSGYQPAEKDEAPGTKEGRGGGTAASEVLASVVNGVVRGSRGLVDRLMSEVRPTASGLDTLPASGIILAAHHGRASDFRRMSEVLPRKPWLVAADTEFLRPTAMHSRHLGRYRSRLVPLTDLAEPSLTGATSLLAAGEVVVIFPEGDASPTPVVCKGHPEVAWLALTSHVPVIPVIVSTGGERREQEDPVPQVLFGEPLDLSRFWSTPPLSDALDSVVLRGVTDLIMAAIAGLGGLAYMDEYAPAVSAKLAERRAVERAQRRLRHPTEEQKRRLAAQARAERDYRESVELAEAQETLLAWINRVDGNDVPTPADPESTH